MNASSDAAEQVMRMSLEGTEYLVKLSGKGALEAAKLLASIIKQQKQTRGKMRLTNLLKSQKPLMVYTFPKENLEKFKECAKEYGILYAVLKDKNNTDGVFDVVIPKTDEPRLNRIINRFKFSTVNLAEVRTSLETEREEADLPNKETGKKGEGKKQDGIVEGDEKTEPEREVTTAEQNRNDFEVMLGEMPVTENPTMARQKAQTQYRGTANAEDGKPYKEANRPITEESSTMSSLTKKESVSRDASTSQPRSSVYKTPDGIVDVSDVIRKKKEAKAIRDKHMHKVLDVKLPKKKPTER